MVVGDARGESNTTANQEVAHDGLETRLSTLEVGASDQAAVLLGILNNSWVESVLGRTIQINALLLNCGHAVEHGRGKGLVGLNASHQVVHRVDLWKKEHLSVGGPQDDDLVDTLLHVTDVLT